MTDTEQVPEPAHPPSISALKYDIVAGDRRYVAELAVRDQPHSLKAVWRNETGPAEVSC